MWFVKILIFGKTEVQLVLWSMEWSMVESAQRNNHNMAITLRNWDDYRALRALCTIAYNPFRLVELLPVKCS